MRQYAVSLARYELGTGPSDEAGSFVLPERDPTWAIAALGLLALFFTAVSLLGMLLK